MELEHSWKFYFHDPNNPSWGINSYVVVETVETVNDWIHIFKAFKETWSKGMFFLMKEDIKPIWEDDYNKSGGCMSFKLCKTEVVDCWFELTGKLITHALLKNNELSTDKISGVSISPKRNYCIVRIWLSDTELSNSDLYSLSIPPYSKIIYKSHSDNKDYGE
jgi:hypothetical protein